MQQIVLLIVGGIHPPSYTEQILATVAQDQLLCRTTQVVGPPQNALAGLSAFALRQAIDLACDRPNAPLSLLIWAFSAGCVGAAALATYWQRHRGPVLGLLMVDGWGVPRPPGVPVHRLSHDRTTHDTCRWLGAGDGDFYADPAVPHLHLWQHPQAVMGWAVDGTGNGTVDGATPGKPQTAADFLCGRSRDALYRHGLNCQA